jgi:hypothetical protein
MNERLRHRAALLFILAWVCRLHQWAPLLIVVVFVAWVVAHTWLEGARGELFIRRWRRAWPPRALVLIPLLAIGTLALGLSELPVMAKVLPLALSTFALASAVRGVLSSPPKARV